MCIRDSACVLVGAYLGNLDAEFAFRQAQIDVYKRQHLFKITSVDDIDWKTALKIGCFQVLAMIPGTSRSGSTIIGGMLCGCSRTCLLYTSSLSATI